MLFLFNLLLLHKEKYIFPFEASIVQGRMKEQSKHITCFSKTMTESDTLTYYPVS